MPRMNMGMQRFNIGRSLSNTRWDTEMFDVRAEMDSNLNYHENLHNIHKKLGIQTRNYGLEQQEREAHERAREHAIRQDPNRQTGAWQGPANLMIDQRLHAMRPGKRISCTGRVYYEYRANRSDVDPDTGL